MNTTSRSDSYAAAGVDITAGYKAVELMKAHIAKTMTAGALSDIGGFGGLFELDLTGITKPVLVSGTDGVGTKLKVAQLSGKNSTVGIDLVAMCANDILATGAEPLFFLDYVATGKIDSTSMAEIVGGIGEGCRQAGCALIGGEMAEHPGVMDPDDYDLSGFCVGIVDNKKLIDGSDVRIGDCMVGIGSSGVHSNGYSLVRKVLKESGLQGTDPFPGDEKRTVAEVLLEPTIIYVQCVKSLMRDLPIKGMAHITGGGFYDNIPRVLPKQVEADITFGSWDIPPVFHWLKEQAKLSWPEMLQIFNTGIGFVLILPEEKCEEAISRIRAFHLNAWKIGTIAKRKSEDTEQIQVSFD